MKIKHFAVLAVVLFAGKLYGDTIAFTEIGQAINDNDLNVVKKLINSGKASVDESAYQNSREPLLNFAIQNYIAFVGHSANKTGHIMEAFEAFKTLDIIDFLLEKGAPLNEKSQSSGKTALGIAQEAPSELKETIAILISKGAQ